MGESIVCMMYSETFMLQRVVSIEEDGEKRECAHKLSNALHSMGIPLIRAAMETSSRISRIKVQSESRIVFDWRPKSFLFSKTAVSLIRYW